MKRSSGLEHVLFPIMFLWKLKGLMGAYERIFSVGNKKYFADVISKKVSLFFVKTSFENLLLEEV